MERALAARPKEGMSTAPDASQLGPMAGSIRLAERVRERTGAVENPCH